MSNGISQKDYETALIKAIAAMQQLELAHGENARLKVRHAVLEKLLGDAREKIARLEGAPVPEAAPVPASDGPRQFFIDIHRLARTYRQTGIERVMAGLVTDFLRRPPEGYRVEPVYVGDNGAYLYARKFAARLLGRSEEGVVDAPVEGRAGDLFLQLDLGIYHFAPTAELAARFFRQGVRLYYVVYDLLPLLNRQWFLPDTHPRYDLWLRTTAQVADGFLCISKSVASDLARWLQQNRPDRAKPLEIDWFHLGSDIDTAIPSDGVPEGFDTALTHLKRLPVVLMVGTVEPRKGYAQALAAFELLWQKG
ncbi:MAG TPA: hypothetical protein VIM58_07105, partial [Candidatus Methylacidiphilales bacterium]